MDIEIKLLPAVGVFLFPRHIHCSCSTVMALLCTPVSELVSCTFATIPFLMIFSFTCNYRKELDKPECL